MLQKIKQWIKSKFASKQDKAKMKKMKEYYEKLQCGALMLQFMHNDYKKAKKSMNRAQRRRWESALEKKGQFNIEMVTYYSKQIDKVLENINKELAKKNK